MTLEERYGEVEDIIDRDEYMMWAKSPVRQGLIDYENMSRIDFLLKVPKTVEIYNSWNGWTSILKEIYSTDLSNLTYNKNPFLAIK